MTCDSVTAGFLSYSLAGIKQRQMHGLLVQIQVTAFHSVKSLSDINRPLVVFHHREIPRIPNQTI